MLNVLDCTPIAQFAIGMDHRITYWNRACELLTGFSAHEMINTDRQWAPFYQDKRPVLADLIVAGDLETFLRVYQGKGASTSGVVPYAWQATDYFEDLGGVPRHIFFVAAPVVDAEGRIVGAVETLQDISKQVRAERDLRAGEKQYRILTEKVADGILVLQDSTLIFANSASARMLGFEKADELIGRKAVDFVAGDFQEAFRTMGEGFETGELQDKVIKIRCLRADAREIWVEAHNEFIHWEGEPAILATLRDITETRRQEMAIEAEAAELRSENKRLRYAGRGRYRFGRIIGKSEVMQEVYDLILKAAATEDNVLIYGESGTGKELAARAIHELSDRKTNEFVPVNCGAIPEALMESEFFGHKRGAFTGAVADTHGYLAFADGGVLFLDEVGDLPATMQVKLLRAVEGGGYAPVGSNRTETSNCRIVAATNKDLKTLVKDGTMREDFFYRMHVIPFHLPPLRDRKEDIPLLVEHFLKATDNGKNVSLLPERVMEALYRYDWPGNVRELENLLRRYLAMGRIDFLNLGQSSGWERPHSSVTGLQKMTLADAVEHFEKDLLVKALENNQWHKARAAANLGISRRTLFRKLKNLELS
ncbi:MAG: sigma 54-interacting transcriptional regulator [Deltaproteobacteria bacterium]|nr:sigma 54-interacting transcriptional regulator [Deltaproteobacteria bacterium]